jgi:hypothetical protein
VYSCKQLKIDYPKVKRHRSTWLDWRPCRVANRHFSPHNGFQLVVCRTLPLQCIFLITTGLKGTRKYKCWTSGSPTDILPIRRSTPLLQHANSYDQQQCANWRFGCFSFLSASQLSQSVHQLGLAFRVGYKYCSNSSCAKARFGTSISCRLGFLGFEGLTGFQYLF